MSGGAGTGRVVVVGSLNVDLVARVERLPRPGETVTGSDLERTPGGKGLNQAVAAARAGVPVVMIGSVGDDDHGRWLLEVARADGIDVGSVATVAAATGTALITVGPEGGNTIVVSPGANGATGREVVTALTTLALGPGDVVLGQAEIPAEAVVTALRAAAGRGGHDDREPGAVPAPGRRPVGADRRAGGERDRARRAGGRSGWARAGGRRGRPRPGRSRRGHGRRAAPCWRRGPGRVPSSSPSVATVPWPSPPTVRSSSVPGRVVDAVDTVGAGDCLAGWLAAGVAGGRALGPALERAVVAASLAVQRTGAAAAMPDVTEVDAAR